MTDFISDRIFGWLIILILSFVSGMLYSDHFWLSTLSTLNCA